MNTNIISIPKSRVIIIFLTLSIAALLTSCGTALVNLKTDAQQPDAGNAIVVGSILIEPVPEWTTPPGTYWLSIWRGPVPRSEYTITVQPNKEKDLLLQLPEGIYEISAIYAGEVGVISRGHGRKGALGLWFELKDGEVQYIGQLKIAISPDNAFLRRQRDAARDRFTRTISRTWFGYEIRGNQSQPVMYTSGSIEDNFNSVVKLLQNKGWQESSIERLKKSLITASRPE